MIVSCNKSISTNQLPCWINSSPAHSKIQTITGHIFDESLHEVIPNLIAASCCGIPESYEALVRGFSQDGMRLLIYAHGSSMFSATFAMVTFDTLSFSSAKKLVRRLTASITSSMWVCKAQRKRQGQPSYHHWPRPVCCRCWPSFLTGPKYDSPSKVNGTRRR
jgi:hypothetical protein